MITITAVVCLTIAAITGIIKYYDYINPYVDELISSEAYSKTCTRSDGSGYNTDYVVRQYKRTYKNGKVEYFTRDEK